MDVQRIEEQTLHAKFHGKPVLNEEILETDQVYFIVGWHNV